jgi:hypothetical protein
MFLDNKNGYFMPKRLGRIHLYLHPDTLAARIFGIVSMRWLSPATAFNGGAYVLWQRILNSMGGFTIACTGEMI